MTLSEKTNLRKKAITGVVWSAVQSWGRQAIALMVFFLLARLLKPETFGLVASASIFLGLIQVFTDQGFSIAIIQRQEIEVEHLDTAFWTNIAISALMTTFCVVVADSIAQFFKQPELGSIIRWLSISFIIKALSSVQEATLRRKLEFKALAIRELAAVSAGGLVGLGMAFKGFGVWSLVGQQLVNSLVQVIVLWWASDWRPKLRFSKKHFQELFSFGINVVGINLINFFSRRSDDFLISYFLGPVALGYYSLAYRLLLIILQLFTGVMSQVILPSFSKLQIEPEKLRQAFYLVTQVSSLISFPVFMGVAILSPEIIQVFFGKQWLPSIPVMQVLAFVGILESIYFFYTDILMAVGKPFHRLSVDLLNVIVNIIGFIIVVRWGIVAVATAFVIRGYLLAPVALLLLKNLIGIKITKFISQLFIPILSSLIMIFAIYWSKVLLINLVNLPVLLIACTLAGTSAYILSIIIIAPNTFKEILSFTSLSKP